jgi:acetyl esterase/lipase
MLVDNRSSLGLVKALGRRPSCIAAVGHSLGGHNALFLAAFDKRIDVAVSSGGFEPIATDTDAERWSRSSWFVYSPALRNIVTQPAPRKVPFDFSSLIGAIYPRAVMVVQGTQDPTWTHEDLIPEHLKSVEEAYQRTKIAGQFDLSMFKGGHEFPEPEQRDAVEFVRERCRNSVHR